MPQQTFIGSEWALFPPHNNWGGLNIVGSHPEDGNSFDQERAIARVVASRILVVLLMRPGESVFHVRLGIAPDLFDSLNSQTCTYFVHHCKNTLESWNRWGLIGIKQLRVSVDPQTIYTNCIAVNIGFDVIGGGENNVLSFGYFQPQVFHNKVQSVPELIRNISLNGDAFELRSLPSEFGVLPSPISFLG